jgi:hypothetical protein
MLTGMPYSLLPIKFVASNGVAPYDTNTNSPVDVVLQTICKLYSPPDAVRKASYRHINLLLSLAITTHATLSHITL